MLLVWVYLRGLVPILSSLTVPSERREANAEGEKKRREAVADDPNLRNYRLEYYTQDLAAVEKMRREAVADDPNLRNYRLEYYTQDLAPVEKE